MRDSLNRINVALLCATAGLPMIPLFGTKNGCCSCENPNCPAPGRHARTRQGTDDATTDQDIIGHWWREWPKATVGTVLGKGVIALVATGLLGKVGRAELRHARPELKISTLSMYDPSVLAWIEFFQTDVSRVLPCHEVTQGVTVLSDGDVVVMPSAFCGPDAAGRRFIKSLALGGVKIAMAPSCLLDTNGVAIERSVDWHEMVKSCWKKNPAASKAPSSIPIRDVLDPVTSEIADELHERADRIRQRAARTVANIIAIGQELIEAKKLVKHGVFEAWCDEQVGISSKTAQRAMGVARMFAGKNVNLSFWCLDTAYALAARSTPANVRDDVFARCASGEHLSGKVVSALIAEGKRAASELDLPKDPASEKYVEALPVCRQSESSSKKESLIRDQALSSRNLEQTTTAAGPDVVVELSSSTEIERLSEEVDDLPPYLDRLALSAVEDASLQALLVAWQNAPDLQPRFDAANARVRERFVSIVFRPGGLK
jgi:hypothetical protein